MESALQFLFLLRTEMMLMLQESYSIREQLRPSDSCLTLVLMDWIVSPELQTLREGVELFCSR